MIRTRFYINKKEVKNDYRPIIWPIKYPYWRTGEDNKNFILVAYTENEDELYKQWPEAKDTDIVGVNEIKFSDRFPKPDWYEY